MKRIIPLTEEFLYCDPECFCRDRSVEDEAHPCHLCYVADKLAADDNELKEPCYEHRASY